MQPTRLGGAVARKEATDVSSLPLAPINMGSIVLKGAQLPQAEQAVAALNFETIAPGDIINLGLSAEQALGKTLDGFLARLDKKTAAKLFDLFGQLQQGVDDANLPEILEKIQQGEKPGFFQGLFGKLAGKKAEDLMQEFMEELGDMITGRTKTLASSMQTLEGELNTEMQMLFGELKALDSLKKAYAQHFDDFTFEAGVARAFLENARAYVAQEEAKAGATDMVALARVKELQDKLRLLESRALALEGTYTKMPADQLVIQQIEQAGIATLQETATTASSRFASIKMTLLSLQGAFAVKSVQQIAARQQQLDSQLTSVRNAALKDVAVAAAKAPGDNRLEQAKQIEAIIASTREISGLVSAAKAETDQKFEAARQIFAQSRQELAQLASS